MNYIFSKGEPLDPDLVKAIIASESGFKPETTNKTLKDTARGLMQVMDSTRKYLSGPKHKELKNHFVNLTDKEV